MAEAESQHRHTIEKTLLDIQGTDLERQRKERQRGQYLGFVICILAIGGGVWVLSTAQAIPSQIGGGLLSLSGLTSLVLAFITGRRSANQGEADYS